MMFRLFMTGLLFSCSWILGCSSSVISEQNGDEEQCISDCQNKECGDDGCGGSCGLCDSGWSCNVSHVCECIPDCTGIACGNDGCGGSCGNCTGSDICNGSGQCTDSPITVLHPSSTIVTDEIKPFGINLGGDSYWNAILRKERVSHGGFEGTIYRSLTYGPGGDETHYFDWFSGPQEWEDIFLNADAYFVSGPRKWELLDITAVDNAYFSDDHPSLFRFTYTPSGDVPPANSGFMIEYVDDETGFLGQHGGAYWVRLTGSATVNTISGDVPPDSRGKIVAEMNASDLDTASISMAFGYHKLLDLTGNWTLKFWAKGTGTMTIPLRVGGTLLDTYTPPITDTWQQFEHVFTISDTSGYSPTSCPGLAFEVQNGTVLVDEISVIQDGDTNSTPFRDDIVAVLKEMNVGSLRLLQMGGNTIDNHLEPRSSRKAYVQNRWTAVPDGIWPSHPDTNGDAKISAYGLHEFLELNEAVGADPYYCAPGVLYLEEMEHLIEYLAGPTTTPYGQLREERGHSTPWTDVFDAIHIEMGNEAWNTASAYTFGGYNGPEYWSDLFRTAKESPYYNEKIKFHMGGQAVYVGRNSGIVDNHAQYGDYLSVAPYIIHEMDTAQAALSDEELYSWVFGYPWYHNNWGYMLENYNVVENAGIELSIYEVNHHITGGDGSLEQRNKIHASIGGALNVINWMLMLLRDRHVRVQNAFQFIQENYYISSLGGNTPLWGMVLSTKAGEVRYRPTGLALMAVNKVLNGNVVEVAKTGADPTWNCAYQYDGNALPDPNIPYLHVYGTRNGTHRGLIIVNLHRTDALPVEVDLPASAASNQAIMWTLAGPSITATNEYDDGNPSVTLSEQAVSNFVDGYAINVPAHSMIVLQWSE